MIGCPQDHVEACLDLCIGYLLRTVELRIGAISVRCITANLGSTQNRLLVEDLDVLAFQLALEVREDMIVVARPVGLQAALSHLIVEEDVADHKQVDIRVVRLRRHCLLCRGGACCTLVVALGGTAPARTYHEETNEADYCHAYDAKDNGQNRAARPHRCHASIIILRPTHRARDIALRRLPMCWNLLPTRLSVLRLGTGTARCRSTASSPSTRRTLLATSLLRLPLLPLTFNVASRPLTLQILTVCFCHVVSRFDCVCHGCLIILLHKRRFISFARHAHGRVCGDGPAKGLAPDGIALAEGGPAGFPLAEGGARRNRAWRGSICWFFACRGQIC